MDADTPAGAARSVWRMPLVLAMLTLSGLTAALLGTGLWHVLAWLALAVPVGLGLWHALRRSPGG